MPVSSNSTGEKNQVPCLGTHMQVGIKPKISQGDKKYLSESISCHIFTGDG